MKKFTLRLSNKFQGNPHGCVSKIIVNADELEIHGSGHSGVYAFKNKQKQLDQPMEWVACYPMEDTIIEKIEDIKENE